MITEIIRKHLIKLIALAFFWSMGQSAKAMSQEEKVFSIEEMPDDIILYIMSLQGSKSLQAFGKCNERLRRLSSFEKKLRIRRNKYSNPIIFPGLEEPSQYFNKCAERLSLDFGVRFTFFKTLPTEEQMKILIGENGEPRFKFEVIKDRMKEFEPEELNRICNKLYTRLWKTDEIQADHIIKYPHVGPIFFNELPCHEILQENINPNDNGRYNLLLKMEKISEELIAKLNRTLGVLDFYSVIIMRCLDGNSISRFIENTEFLRFKVLCFNNSEFYEKNLLTLADRLKETEIVEELFLNNNFIALNKDTPQEVTVEAFNRLLMLPTLRILDLSYNFLAGPQAQALADAIENTHSQRERFLLIDLRDNNFTDECPEELKHALNKYENIIKCLL